MNELNYTRKEELSEENEDTTMWLATASVEAIYHISQIGLWVAFCENSRSYLGGLFWLVIFILDICHSVYYLRLKEDPKKCKCETGECKCPAKHHHKRHHLIEEDINPLNLLPVIQCFTWKCYTDTPLWWWYVSRNVFWSFLLLFWMRYEALAEDINGTGWFLTSFSNQSSCSAYGFVSTGVASGCTNQAPDGTLYNPQGVFNQYQEFQPSGIYANCWMDQTWSGPLNEQQKLQVNGYAQDEFGHILCSQPLTGGIIPLPGCPFQGYTSASEPICQGSFPEKWAGVQTNTMMSYLYNNSNNIKYCPGNMPSPVQVPGAPVPMQILGDPLPLCPYCLFYALLVQGVAAPQSLLMQCGLNGWDGVSQIPPTLWLGWNQGSSWCSLCPGRGQGTLFQWEFWVQGTDTQPGYISHDSVNATWWLATIMTFMLPGLRIALIFFVIFLRLLCDRGPKKTKRKKHKNHDIHIYPGT